MMDAASFRAARLTLGLTMDQMADLVRVNVRNVERFEIGEKVVPGAIAVLIDLIINVPEVRKRLAMTIDHDGLLRYLTRSG